MGASKKEYEKMNYVIFTEPMTVAEFHKEFEYNKYVKKYDNEPNDYEEKFKNNNVYQKLNDKYKEVKNARQKYKELVRNNNN